MKLSSNAWCLGGGVVLAVAMGGTLAGYGFPAAVAWTAAVTTLCAVWWITEPIPVPATSLIPFAVFPLVEVLTPGQVGEALGSPLILLLMGGFVLSAAMERSGAHRRIALAMVRAFGNSSGRRLVFGFMAAAAVLSMWISNSATTLMLLPIALAVIEQTENRRLQTALLIGIAYAASIGGIGTPIGTPPNLVFMEVYRENTGREPAFLQWMMWTLPIVLVMLPLAGFWLTRGMSDIEPIDLPAVGKWRPEEIRTLAIFVITALFWMTRTQPAGGWTAWLGIDAEYARDSSVALLGAVALFLIPGGQGRKLMDWETAARIPWGILLLFAGGICIAKAFVASGLSRELGQSLAAAGTLPLLLLIGVICLGVTFLTEITSNTATTTLLMPILAAAAIQARMDPVIFMVPATLSASFAFMLPVATAPNAIVFGSEKLTVRDMAREGIVLNLAGVLVVTLICRLLFR